MSKTSLVTLLTSEALPLDTVKVGRLIVERKQPWQDFCAYDRIQPRKNEISSAPFDHVKDESEQTSTWGVVGAIGEFFQAMFNSEKRLARKLNTDHAVVWRLLNSPGYLERLSAKEYVREWLQRRIDIEEKRVYLVTGLVTVQDAAMNRDASSSTQADVTLKAPVTTALTHGTSGALPLDGKGAAFVDPKVAVKKGSAAKTTISLDAPGTRIVAVEYTRVRLRKHLSAALKDTDVFLQAKSSRWKDSFRGTGSGEDEIFEVYLGPADMREDDEEDEDGEQEEKVVVLLEEDDEEEEEEEEEEVAEEEKHDHGDDAVSRDK